MADSRNFHIKFSPEGYEALEAIAEEERRSIADVVRQAVEEYASRKGIQGVRFDVSRGGYRERKSSGEHSA